jgi:hypothetical protein
MTKVEGHPEDEWRKVYVIKSRIVKDERLTVILKPSVIDIRF